MTVPDLLAYAQSAHVEWERAEKQYREKVEAARKEGPPGSAAAETIWSEARHLRHFADAWRTIAAARSLDAVAAIADGVVV